MKIKWIEGERNIPPIGRMQTGMVVDILDDMARDLIRQGMAKKYKESRRDPGSNISRVDAAPTE